MKIKQAVYDTMKADIAAVCASAGIDLATAEGGKTGLKTVYGVLSKVSFDRAYDDSHPAFASGRAKRILPHDGREYCFYYADGCNDEHVATALRRIKAELTAHVTA